MAIKLDEIEITYRALDAASAAAADLLRGLGVEPGDRVGLMVPNVPQFAVAYYGILRAGAVVVPMNVLLKERETGFYLSDSQAKAVFAWHEFAPAAKAGADARAPSRRGRAGSSSAARRDAATDRTIAPREDRRHRGDPLHLGHDRPAQGRRAHARQPARNDATDG